jgi:fructose-specific phosphotransferase system IIC component
MQIGGSIGTAVIAIILSGQIARSTADAPGLSGAFNNTFWWALGFTLVGLVPALILPSRAPKAEAPAPVAPTTVE